MGLLVYLFYIAWALLSVLGGAFALMAVSHLLREDSPVEPAQPSSPAFMDAVVWDWPAS